MNNLELFIYMLEEHNIIYKKLYIDTRLYKKKDVKLLYMYINKYGIDLKECNI